MTAMRKRVDPAPGWESDLWMPLPAAGHLNRSREIGNWHFASLPCLS
jgi:hypothetical protein